MVTSIAMPNATLNTNTVDGFKDTPTQPIMPAVISNGTILGNNEHINMGKDLNKNNMHNAINKKAQKIDSPNPRIIKLLPSKKVTLLPVICIVYLELSNIDLVALSNLFKKIRKAQNKEEL